MSFFLKKIDPFLRVLRQHQCCGSDSHLSWLDSHYSRMLMAHDQEATDFYVPESCCVDAASQACQQHRRRRPDADVDPTVLFADGCVSRHVGASHFPYGRCANT